MSISRVVQTPTEPPKEAVAVVQGPTEANIPKVEVPYTSYEQENHHPYIVDHYELGNSSSEFETEIKNIDGYFKDQAEHGKIDNKLSTIKGLIAKYEKMANIGKEERTVMKIAKLSAFVKFLRESEHINSEVGRYG